MSVQAVDKFSAGEFTMNRLTVYKASSFWLRLRGLLGRSPLKETEALHIEPCADVHSFGMKYALDIVFLNSAGTVIKTGLLKPNSWMKCKGARAVIELKAGCAERYGLLEGMCANDLNYISIGDRNEL